jgi:hypothetical protein
MNVFNRKGRKAFIYRRNFAPFVQDFAFFAVYIFLILLHINSHPLIDFVELKFRNF